MQLEKKEEIDTALPVEFVPKVCRVLNDFFFSNFTVRADTLRKPICFIISVTLEKKVWK